MLLTLETGVVVAAFQESAWVAPGMYRTFLRYHVSSSRILPSPSQGLSSVLHVCVTSTVQMVRNTVWLHWPLVLSCTSPSIPRIVRRGRERRGPFKTRRKFNYRTTFARLRKILLFHSQIGLENRNQKFAELRS